MNHFRIIISANRNEFEYRCNQINEAYDAIEDASKAFGIGFDLDKVMRTLVDMDRGKILSSDWGRLRIEKVLEDEV